LSIAIDLIRKRLDAESKRINATAPVFGECPKTNAVTEALNMLLVEVALEEAKAVVKPIVDVEVAAENHAKGLHL
jgi:hypothetical protein